MQWPNRLALVLLVTALMGATATTQGNDPMDCVLMFQQAMDGIQPENVSRIVFPANSRQRSTVDAMEKLADAIGHLRKELMQTYGPQANALLRPSAKPVRQSITGDSAVVYLADGNKVNLVQQGGKWRIPITAALAQREPELRRMADIFNGIARETRAGRFDNPDEVLRTIQEQLMYSNARPTSGPSTVATTRP